MIPPTADAVMLQNKIIAYVATMNITVKDIVAHGDGIIDRVVPKIPFQNIL